MIDLPEDFRDLLIELGDAVDAQESFEVEGRRIPVIGLAALLKNKRAAAREQDLADVKALETIAGRSTP